MRDDSDPTCAQISARRTNDSDHPDPLRFAFIEALERRISDHQGEARAKLEERLRSLVDASARESAEQSATSASAACATSPGALGRMLKEWMDERNQSDPATGHGSAYPELPLLHDARALWNRMRTEGQVRQSLQALPEDAGPLNSATLVHRSLGLMRETSPEYLQHFVAYVDALSSLERLREAIAPTPAAPPRESRRGTARRGSRKQAASS